ncbi:phosphatase 2C-like domain-containing protein [Flagelloscypha sp. PMI_526]|nr:phosphatase 2C-like domain-containing protein [Flagelloscypha sp. PMI_526]
MLDIRRVVSAPEARGFDVPTVKRSPPAITRQGSSAFQFLKRSLSFGKKAGNKERPLPIPVGDFRSQFVDFATSEKSEDGLVSSATFQPVTTRQNEDRLVFQKWEIDGRSWRFLAVMDGHGGGGIVSEHAVRTLPALIRKSLEECSTLNPSNVSDILRDSIQSFDESLFEVLRALCPCPSSPESLSPEAADDIVNNNLYLMQRAMFGSTLTLALVDEDEKQLWAASLGDSTVALSTIQPSGRRSANQLLEHHNASNYDERMKMLDAHPGENVFDEEYVWGTIAMTRALGDFPYKVPLIWSEKYFFRTPSKTRSNRYVTSIRSNSKTPPYVLSEPSIRHLSLAETPPGQEPYLILFSDGIDLLVDGVFTYRPREKYKSTQIVASLLADTPDAESEVVMGHRFEMGWSEAGGNKALEVLGNLLAGTDGRRWLRILNAGDENPESFYVDDATIVVYDMRTLFK